MNIVYFSHSYRPEDARVGEYFGTLMGGEGIAPGVDPPSDPRSRPVNAAKLERYLAATDGMVAVLTWREGGVSEYILFEISLCLKDRKPILVFVEDNLPDDIIPSRLLQRRFSRGSLLRQTREHRHALQVMKTYLGDTPSPKYQPFVGRRSCVLVGMSHLPPSTREGVIATVSDLGYSAIQLDEPGISPMYDQSTHETITSADVALCFVDADSPNSQFLIGAIWSSPLPTIALTARTDYEYHPGVPQEFQPRMIRPNDVEDLCRTIRTDFATFEEDFLQLTDEAQVEKYWGLLLQGDSLIQRYGPQTRNVYIKQLELVMGDKYSTTYVQIWNQVSSDIDLRALATELSQLRATLKEQAIRPEHDVAIGSVALAEQAAQEGDGPKALECLAKGGTWALDVATKIGTTMAAGAIRSTLGI